MRLLALSMLISLLGASTAKVGEHRHLPQNTTTTAAIGLFGYFTSKDSCFDPYGWCKLYIQQTCSVYAQNSGDWAYCYLANRAYCAAAEQAHSSAIMFAHGSAELSVTQHGNSGAINEVTLDTSSSALTLTTAFASSSAAAGASGTFRALSVSDPASYCGYISNWKNYWWGWQYFYSLYCADASAVSFAYGSVQAGSKSSAFGSAIAASGGTSSTDLEVQGSNILNVKAKVVNGFSSFAYTATGSVATAYTQTITNTITSSFTQLCQDNYYFWCSWWGCGSYDPAAFCSTAQGYSASSATAFASAFAAAAAGALSQIELTLIYDAEVDQTPGNTVTLGVSGGGEVTIGAVAQCV